MNFYKKHLKILRKKWNECSCRNFCSKSRGTNPLVIFGRISGNILEKIQELPWASFEESLPTILTKFWENHQVFVLTFQREIANMLILDFLTKKKGKCIQYSLNHWNKKKIKRCENNPQIHCIACIDGDFLNI